MPVAVNLSDAELSVKFKLLPQHIKVLRRLQQRKFQLKELSGRPLWESVEEVAIVYYMQKQNRSLTAKLLDVSEKTLERLNNSIEKDHKCPIFNPSLNTTVVVNVETGKLIEMVTKAEEDIEEVLRRTEIDKKVLTRFTVVREFIENPVRVEQRSRYTKYTESQVNETLKALLDIILFLSKNRDKYKVPLNPDMWTLDHEDELYNAINALCTAKHGIKDEIKLRSCRADYMIKLRRIKRFYDMGLFRGRMGKVTSRIKPREEFLTLEQYRRLYEVYKNTNDHDYKAWFEIMTFHLLTGAREGYESVPAIIERLKAHGITQVGGKDITEINEYSIDLDEDIVKTSLIGIKWENFRWINGDFEIEIYEEKTSDVWKLLSCWIGEWFSNILKERHEYAQKNNIRSVVKTILHYYQLYNYTNIGRFKQW
ncbi:MAG: hypothetical protein QW503_02385, partial [Sulfolobales archaeon]